MRRWTRRVAACVLIALALFVIAAIVMARPGDLKLYPATAGASVAVFVVSHGYHAGLLMPRETLATMASQDGDAALGAIGQRFAGYPWLEIGWGDEGFYASVPTIGHLTFASAVRALFRPGNRSVLHVVGVPDDLRVAFPAAAIVRLDLTQQGFRRLLARLDATFAADPQGAAIQDLGPGLYGPSRFYRAVGSFNLLNVCNHWTAGLLDAAGVPTDPVLATLPFGLLLDLRWRAAAASVP
jgi:uncharacterized protein (TIGR02117 family)